MSEQQIWIPVENMGWDGYDTPRVAFTTEQAATAWADRNPSEYGSWEIVRVLLDPAPEESA